MRDRVEKDPWLIAYECSRGNCDLDEVSRILREKLSADTSSEDYVYGLELFKALKSQLQPHVFIEVLKKTLTRGLVDKIMGEVNCDRIIEYYKVSKDLGYSLLTLLEIYPLIGQTDFLKSIVKGTIHKALNELDEKERLELCRALIHGPIASLPPGELKDILEVFIENIHDKPCLLAASDLLVMIVQNYTPKSLLENPEIVEYLGELVKAVAEKTLITVEEDPDKALEIYHQLSLFKTLLNNICRELNNWEPCRRITEKGGETLETLFRELGKIEILNSSVSTENYTSS